MTDLHLLDTDILSYAIKGHPPSIRAKLSAISPDRVCLSAVTQAELMYGLKRLPPFHHLHLGVREFLETMRILAWDSRAAHFYADIQHQLTTTGQPIGELDVMIASHALALGAVLVTNNTRHFERIQAPLKIAHWRE